MAIINPMNSPRSGFRRAAVASWTLAGIGIAGVAGASALAYADTYKPPVAEVPVDAPEAIGPEAPAELPPPSLLAPPVAPAPAADAPAPAPAAEPAPAPAPEQAPAPEPVGIQAPVQTYVPQQQTYTPPKQTYVQPAPVQQAPVQQAPVQQAPKSTSSFPIRQSHVPAGGGQTSGGNSFSPHVTFSRGS